MKRLTAEKLKAKALKDLADANKRLQDIGEIIDVDFVDLECIDEGIEVDPSTDKPIESGGEKCATALPVPVRISEAKLRREKSNEPQSESAEIPSEPKEQDQAARQPKEQGQIPSESTNQDERPRQSKKVHQWSEEWWAQARPEVQAHRCKAHRKNGARCLKAAINGGTVCRYHGGAAKHVKAAARARLDKAADRMARNLLRLADDADSEQVQLKATDSALDRVGIRPPNEVFISPGQGKPYEEVFEGISTMTREESRAATYLEPDTEPEHIGVQPHSLDDETASYSQNNEPVSGLDRHDTTPAPVASDQVSQPRDREPQTGSDIEGRQTRDNHDCDRPESTLSDEPSSQVQSHQDERLKRSGGRSRSEGHQRQAQPRSDVEALAEANRANRAIGSLPPPKALGPGRIRRK